MDDLEIIRQRVRLLPQSEQRYSDCVTLLDIIDDQARTIYSLGLLLDVDTRDGLLKDALEQLRNMKRAMPWPNAGRDALIIDIAEHLEGPHDAVAAREGMADADRRCPSSG